MRTTFRSAAVAVAVTTAIISFAAASPAGATTAAPPTLHIVKTIASDFVGPLQFGLSGKDVVVADSFTGTLNLVGKKSPIAVVSGDATDLSGVGIRNVNGNVTIAYNTSNDSHSSTKLIIHDQGKADVVADLSLFEKNHNPDGDVNYGAAHTGNTAKDTCIKNALDAFQIPYRYKGIIDSHPYSVTAINHDAWAVADAGANDVVRVNKNGGVSTISVLPRQPLKITHDFAASQGLPSCVEGATYYFEPVPTDVELGPDGRLYVTALPGGPEDPSAGARGDVYRIEKNGAATKLAGGLAGATNLAVDNQGGIYAVEIFKGDLVKLVNGSWVPVFAMPGLVSVEWANGHLYVSTAPAATGAPGPGAVYELG
jgi:hypothetical protein